MRSRTRICATISDKWLQVEPVDDEQRPINLLVVGMEDVRQEARRATVWRLLYDQKRIFWFARG